MLTNIKKNSSLFSESDSFYPDYQCSEIIVEIPYVIWLYKTKPDIV